ncbi:hypothetical protein [Mariniblastus fucicola]|uniref:Ferric reductase like transmembrane component n=1 Tax=Mariniblastus fucicola TaxID=980251 RepID=A0A5B9PFX0_9BACT|nr:hypothetical protein [Mariniblastus fucicola]QEG24110.1 Ferric reductase like transmembrane component [Mariniblastus fucicola]
MKFLSQMNRLSRRRLRNVTLTVASIAMLAAIVMWMDRSLLHSSFLTGYVLIGSLFLLAAFGMRKRLPMIAGIGSASFWMQMHIYVGLGSFAVFAMHIAFRVPDGMLESILALLYLVVFFSGIYGIWATRSIPRKLTSVGEEVIFERIPAFKRHLARRAQTIVMESCESTPVLANFYVNRLSKFFECRRGLGYMLIPTGRKRRHLIAEIEELDRFLAQEDRRVSRELAIMVRKKDDLDYHTAMQGRLKLWLFVHIAITWSLLIFSVVHGLLAHAYGGGLA